MAAFYGDTKVASLAAANIEYMTNSEYQAKKALGTLDASTYYATIPDGQKTEVIVTKIATEGNDVATITVDGTPTTIKSGPVGSAVSLSDVKTGGLKVADITINGTLSSLTTEALPANSKTQAGIVTKGEGNEDKVWGTNSEGTPGWRNRTAVTELWRDEHGKTGEQTITTSQYWTNFDALMFLYSSPVESATTANVGHMATVLVQELLWTGSDFGDRTMSLTDGSETRMKNEGNQYYTGNKFSIKFKKGTDTSTSHYDSYALIAVYGIKY